MDTPERSVSHIKTIPQNQMEEPIKPFSPEGTIHELDSQTTIRDPEMSETEQEQEKKQKEGEQAQAESQLTYDPNNPEPHDRRRQFAVSLGAQEKKRGDTDERRQI